MNNLTNVSLPDLHFAILSFKIGSYLHITDKSRSGMTFECRYTFILVTVMKSRSIYRYIFITLVYWLLYCQLAHNVTYLPSLDVLKNLAVLILIHPGP